jgi:hypothetical protein
MYASSHAHASICGCMYLFLQLKLCDRFNCAFFLVIGALIGKQKGRNLEIMNSFELLFSCIGDDTIIDRDYYNTKGEQCK